MAANLSLTAKVSGDATAILLNQWREQDKPIRDVVIAASSFLQSELREQVRAAGLGPALANAWRTLPPDNRFKWSALVYSKSVRLHEAFNSSETIRARNGKWLAIPTPEAVRLGLATDARRNKGPSGIARRWSNVEAAIKRFGDLRFIRLPGGRALLTAPVRGRARGGKKPQGEPLFFLVPQAHRAKRLDLEGATRRTFAKLKADMARVLEAR